MRAYSKYSSCFCCCSLTPLDALFHTLRIHYNSKYDNDGGYMVDISLEPINKPKSASTMLHFDILFALRKSKQNSNRREAIVNVWVCEKRLYKKCFHHLTQPYNHYISYYTIHKTQRQSENIRYLNDPL